MTWDGHDPFDEGSIPRGLDQKARLDQTRRTSLDISRAWTANSKNIAGHLKGVDSEGRGRLDEKMLFLLHNRD